MSSLLKVSTIAVTFLLMACGQDPAFLELEGVGGKSKSRSNGSVSDTGQTVDGVEDQGVNSGDAVEDGYGEDLDGDGWPDEVSDGSDNGGKNNGGNNGGSNGGNNNGGNNDAPDPDDVFIPDASPDDQDDLRKCLALWGNKSPFGATITNFEKVYASVTIGGSGTPINDTVRTEDPKLILVVASVAVNSNVTYNMLNPNGYYCIKVGVNVETDLTANIHCSAHVAQTNVNVSVGSSGDPLASVGVNVNSDTQVNIVRPADDNCRI
jgi:hypothetical protein